MQSFAKAKIGGTTSVPSDYLAQQNAGALISFRAGNDLIIAYMAACRIGAKAVTAST
jgi:hypothetical protein